MIRYTNKYIEALFKMNINCIYDEWIDEPELKMTLDFPTGDHISYINILIDLT